MSIKAVRGVHDILPAEAEKWQRIEAAARRLFDAFGYDEIRLPIFERTELFARSIGEVTDIVQKEMYTFEDRSGESVTLRPEATASILRAYIEHGWQVLPKPIKVYTMGPMFRYERPQAGRYRQFHQINVEAIGEEHPAVDAEVMGMLVELFRKLRLFPRLALQVNSLGDATCRPAYRERLVGYFRHHRERLCEDCRDRTERNPLRVLDCKNPSCRPILDAAPSVQDSLCGECRDHFRRVLDYLETMKIPYEVNVRLVRGLDYYVRTTFEMTTTELGAQTAVAGGGRYDGLIQQLGGPADPGIGFAIGVERLALLLGQVDGDASGARRPLAYLIPLGEEALRRILPVAETVRAAEPNAPRVELAYGGRKLRAELERANKLGARYAVIVGENEIARGEATVREMKSGQQRVVPLAGLAAELLALGGES